MDGAPHAGPPFRRSLGRSSVIVEVGIFLGWAALTAFVFEQVSGSTASKAVAGLFTGLGAVAVVTVMLHRRLADRRIRQGLEAASAALRAIEAVTDPSLSFLALDALLDEVLLRTRQAMGGDVSSVLLLRDKHGRLRARAAQGAEAGAIVAEAEQEGGVLRAIAEGGRGTVINEAEALWSRPSVPRRPGSLAAAPLLIQGEVIGVVVAAGGKHDRFDEGDLRLLQVVADRCAASIERARLDDAERRSRLGAEHARLHLGLLARASYTLATALESYDRALLALSDVVVPDFADWFCVDVIDDTGELRRVAYAPRGAGVSRVVAPRVPVPHRHSQGDRLVRLAIADGQPQIVMPRHASAVPHEGVAAAPGEHFEPSPDDDVESMVVVPIRVRGASFGALSFVTGAGRRGYRRSDVETAREVSERVAVMIERVFAWRQSRASEAAARRYAARLQRLMEAALVVNAPLAEDEVLEVLSEHARRVLDASRVALAVPRPEGPVVEKMWPAEAAKPGDPEVVRAATMATDIVVHRGQPRRFPEAAEIGQGPAERSRGGPTPWLAVPLTDDEGTTKRVIVVFGKVGALFDDEDESVLVLLAQMAAVALRNAQLYQEVQANEQRLRAVLDSSPLAITELDFTGRPRWWNQAAMGLFGWEPDGAAARVLPIGDAATQVVAGLLARTRAGEATLGTELTATRSDGQALELSISTAPLRDRHGIVSGVLMVVGDVTERRRLLEQFHQTERLSAMARMAGGLAHDFNNLLTVILGCSEVLMRRAGDEPVVQEEVGAIQRAGQRAAALTSQLLSIGHRRGLQPVVVDLNEVALSMQPMLSSVLGDGIELEVVPYSRPARVLVDPAELERAVLNLAINSRDAMPDGGRLLIQVKASGPARRDDPDSERLCGLVVSDTGVGMDLETQDHCFEPFFTTKGLARGTGLGLATVHATVTQAGGQVILDSAPGAGTTITLWFPAHRAAAAKPGGEGPAAAAGSSGTERILVVEDEPELRRLVDRELSARGYSVRAAANAVEALRIVGDDPATFALVVSDVVMPGMSGVELARMLHGMDPSVPVLFVSGHIEEDRSSAYPLSEEADLLAKPFTPEQLAGRVRAAIDNAREARAAGGSATASSDQGSKR
jgi:PAS domain S-box-containing protein